MPSSIDETKQILGKAEDILKTAEIGLEMLKSGNPNIMLPGLNNLVVFGRAITNVLQQLRSSENEFDLWYTKYREEMKDDPLLKFFYKLRSEILKEGKVPVSTSAYIESFYPDIDLRRIPKPPNAKAFFIGDRYGGSGWEVELPDGTIQKYYVQLPKDIGVISLLFKNPPNKHLGKNIKNKSPENLSELYIEYLRKMVKDAKKHFSPNKVNY